MKIIAIGDPHFQAENALEVNQFIEKLLILVNEEKPDLIVVLGDLLHTHERLHTMPLNKAYEFIDKLRLQAPTMVLVGNHDMINNRQYLSSHHWMNGMKEWENVEIVDKVVIKKLKNRLFYFVPYVPPGRFEEALNGSEGVSTSPQPAWRKADCIFAHQEFYGCKMGAIVSIEGDKWPENYPEVVSGHIHSRQMVGKNIYYCGSSMQHAFGESEKNIIPILTWKDTGKESREQDRTKYSLKEVDLGLPRKKIVYADVSNIDDLKIPESKDKIKVTLSGNYEEFKAFKKTKQYREMTKNGTKVVFKPKKIEKPAHVENVEEITETDFTKVLYDLVMLERNPQLYQMYELIVNNKEVKEEDIMFLN